MVINFSGSGSYGSNAPEGAQVGWVEEPDEGYPNPGGLAHILTETLTADTTYTLSVQVGNNTYYTSGDYVIELRAGGTVLADFGENAESNIPDDTFELRTVTYTYDPLDAALVGEPLEIRLIVDGAEVDFDDVQLTATPVYPFPAVHTVTLTLAVNDDGNPTPVKDTMTIDVYDDACQAARIGLGLAAENPGDLNADCDTDVVDLQLFTANWLAYYLVDLVTLIGNELISTTPNTTYGTETVQLAGLLDDPFAYDPDNPTSPMPQTSWEAGKFFHGTNTYLVVIAYDFDNVYSNIFVDLYGRSDSCCTGRDDSFNVEFYLGGVLQETIAGSIDGTFHDRVTASPSTQADAMRIVETASSADNFTLAEVRVNGNTPTDLEGFAIVAAKWLVDYALTAPVPIP